MFGSGSWLQDFVAEFRKHFGDLAEQVVAICAGEVVHGGVVPPLGGIVCERVVRQTLDRQHPCIETGSKKNGNDSRSRGDVLITRWGVER